jgi:hypothetical protein
MTRLRTTQLKNSGSIPGKGKRIVSICKASIPALGPTQSPVQWILQALFLAVKWPGRETNHSHTVPSVRKSGSIARLSVGSFFFFHVY